MDGKMSSLSEEENQIIYSYLENNDVFLIIATKFQLEMIQKFGHEKICVDSTHGTTEYDLLTTLVVVDEYGNGFPCCLCFTKKKDTITWITFFTKVKERTGNINTKVFMSDDDPAFYNNAWCNVMGNAEHKLLCSWHVDHYLRQTTLKQNWLKN
uniref:MULE transposase domain-containing protein n=1 Tax=Schizaphis graminum TaxID=13262 RepID=A0A2S2PIF0_SCHGA